MTGRARLPRLVLASMLALLVAACAGSEGSDGSAAPSTSDTTTSLAPGSLPPPDALDLEAYYGAALADLGLRLTDRGGLIDLGNGGYAPSAEGRHLALYVEPIAARTTAEYIDGIRAVGAVFADVFDRWPGLESYDVCQEPVDPDGTQAHEPLPVTQIALSREQAAEIDWDTITVVDMVRSARAEPPGISVRVSTAVSHDPLFEAITAEALGTP